MESDQQYLGFRWWNKGGGSRTSNNHFPRDILRADGTRASVSFVAICRIKFAGETSDAAAGLYLTAEEARITCAILDAAAEVRGLNFKYLAEDTGATVTARDGKNGITICEPNRASEGARVCEEQLRCEHGGAR